MAKKSKYRCPVCGKPLTKKEYEKALKIHEARELHFRHLESALKKREKQLGKKVEQAKKQAQKKERRRAERLMAGQRERVRKLQERIRQLERGSTPQTEGLEFEEKLAARLRREFPEDEIQHKGKGGDVLHFVMFQAKRAGIIIYECKRTPRIKDEHVHQAHLAKQLRQADFAVLVTTGRKKGFSGLAHIRGVLVVAPLGVVSLASLLRAHLIEMLRAKISKERRAKTAQALLKYITSPQFKNPIEEIIETSAELQEMIRLEARDHMRVWKKRWEHYQTIQWDGSQIRSNLQLVLHGKEPKSLVAPKAPPLRLLSSG